MFVLRLPSFSFAQLALQENEPPFDMLAFRSPGCDRDDSSVHALVATCCMSGEFSEAPDQLVVYRP